MKVIGMQVKDVVSKKTGNPYKAAILFVTYESKNVTGLAAMQVYTTVDRVPVDIALGDEVNVLYNRFGNVESVEKL